MCILWLKNLMMKIPKILKNIFAVIAVILVVISCKNSPPTNIASSNHGEAIMKAQCLSCHGADLISQQRLTKVGWTKEVEKMMRWGAEVKDSDKEPLVEFLAANYPSRSFSKEPPPPPAAALDAKVIAHGKTIFETKCLTCHGEDLVKQQRLSKIGWTKEVEKMTRWGTEISDEEKVHLIEYLSSEMKLMKEK